MNASTAAGTLRQVVDRWVAAGLPFLDGELYDPDDPDRVLTEDGTTGDLAAVAKAALDQLGWLFRESDFVRAEMVAQRDACTHRMGGARPHPIGFSFRNDATEWARLQSILDHLDAFVADVVDRHLAEWSVQLELALPGALATLSTATADVTADLADADPDSPEAAALTARLARIRAARRAVEKAT